jgi:hypothetical protein
MIYMDNIGHLMTDGDLEELHVFAEGIGLQRVWFQDRKKYPHYDLTSERKRRQAISSGAKVVNSRELILLCARNDT